MAYGTKYTCYHNVNINGTNIDYEIRIKQNGFVGSTTEVVGSSEAFSLNYENSSITDFLKNPIQKGRLEFYLMVKNSTDQGIVEDIADSSEDDWQMELWVDDSLNWRGWVLPDLIEFSQGDYPYACTITAKDFTILGSLEYPLNEQVFFTDDANVFGLAKHKTLIALISELQSKSNLSISNIDTYTNWINLDMTESAKGQDFLQNTFVRPFALRNYGNEEDGFAIVNNSNFESNTYFTWQQRDGGVNAVNRALTTDDTPLTVEQALSLLLINFGLILRQAEGCIKLYQLSAMNIISDDIQKTRYIVDANGKLLSSGIFGTNKVAKSTETIVQETSSNTFLLPSSTNTYLPTLKTSSVTYNHRTTLDKLRATNVSEINISRPNEKSSVISSQEEIYPDGVLRFYINYSIESGFSASFDALSNQDEDNILIKPFVELEIKLDKETDDDLYLSSETNTWTTTESTYKIPLEGFTEPTFNNDLNIIGVSGTFSSGSKSFITPNVPSGSKGVLKVTLFNAKAKFTGISGDYVYVSNASNTIESYSSGSRYNLANSTRYNRVGFRPIYSDDVLEGLDQIALVNASESGSQNEITVTSLTKDLKKGDLIYFEGDGFIDSLKVRNDASEGDTSIDIEQRSVSFSIGDKLYEQNDEKDTTSITYTLTNDEVVSTSDFDYGTVLYGDGVTDNSIGAIAVESDTLSDLSDNDWFNVTSYGNSFSKWKRISDDDDDATSIFKLLLRESMQGRGVTVNSQLVYRPNRVIQSELYAPYFGHKILKADSQNFFFISGSISGNGFTIGQFIQVPNRTPKAILTNLLTRGSDGVFRSSGGAKANFSQSFANSQFVTQTSSILSGTITEINVQPIGFSVGKVGDTISIIDNASGILEEFTLTETYKPNDLILKVESKSLDEPLGVGSFVVYDAKRVTSYITQTDEAIRLGVRSAETATTDDGFVLTDEDGDEYRFVEGDTDARIDETKAEVAILSNQIVLKVDANGVISAVSLTADAEDGSAVTIEADNINLNGVATFLSSDSSFISAVGNEVGEFDFTPVTVYEQTTEPSGGTYVMGDVWIDTDDGNSVYVYNGSAWVAQFTEIDGGTITTGTIDSAQIATNAITADKIQAGVIDASKIDVSDVISVVNSSTDNTTRISGDGIQANAISADKITSNAITTDKIQANAVEANKLDVDTEGAIRLNVKTHDRALASDNDELVFSDNSEIAFVEGDNDAREAYLSSLVQAEEDRINLQVRELGALSGFGTLPLQQITQGDTVSTLGISANSDTRLDDGQVIGVVGLGGEVDLYTVDGTATLDEGGLVNVGVVSKTSNITISRGSGYVVIPDSQVSSQILVNKDSIALNASNISSNNSSIASVDVRVSDVESNVVLVTDTNGNVSSIDLSSGNSGSNITIQSDQINIEGVITAVNNGTTTIDGGRITTDSITANQIDVDDLFSEQINVGNYIQSSNYSAGTSGFRLNSNGSAEFGNVTIRGNIGESVIQQNVIIDTNGIIATNDSVLDSNPDNGIELGQTAIALSGTYTTIDLEFPYDGTTVDSGASISIGGTATTLSADLEDGDTSISIASTSLNFVSQVAIKVSRNGVLIDKSGVYIGKRGQTKANANIRLLEDGTTSIKGQIIIDSNNSIDNNGISLTSYTLGAKPNINSSPNIIKWSNSVNSKVVDISSYVDNISGNTYANITADRVDFTLSEKTTITGPKGGNTALANLLSELEAIGLITDSTT